jgi:quinol-cytochrome oxidoreductase complex cytochrome b subunit
MIQRIQSVYLLLVAVLMGCALVAPLCSFTLLPDAHISLTSVGMFTEAISYPTYGIVTIGLISALMAFVEIFFHKKRKLQIKLSNINAVLMILFLITVVVYAYVGMQKYDLEFSRIGSGLIFSVVAFIFNLLAKQKIKQDEKLVRSLDRIR